jgi:hypothetical protein
MDAEILLSIVVGVALAAACGFRVFVPLFVISIASHTGHLSLSPGFEWIGSTPARIGFGVATALEIAGYYIPWVDHALDVLATPAAVVAGTVAMGSSMVSPSPFLHWTLALIAGGGVAGFVQAATGLIRLTSTATTGGLGNPLVATVEAGGSLALSVLAILMPVAAAVCVTILLGVAVRKVYERSRRPARPHRR